MLSVLPLLREGWAIRLAFSRSIKVKNSSLIPSRSDAMGFIGFGCFWVILNNFRVFMSAFGRRGVKSISSSESSSISDQLPDDPPPPSSSWLSSFRTHSPPGFEDLSSSSESTRSNPSTHLSIEKPSSSHFLIGSMCLTASGFISSEESSSGNRIASSRASASL